MSDAVARLTSALADRYRIERELGQGGMATVYLAHDLRHDRKVALKLLRPELAAILGAERFLAEIKTTANLQHPHILSLFDSGEADGLVFYVMPYVEGESLRDRLKREHQLPVEDAIRITREVADALDYAHRHHVIHRDIKPENILLHDGHTQVADFGIALAVSRSDGGTRMTETGMSLGTPHYMAPEQAMGEKEITPKADVYALGCVLYEMLVGEPPFTGPTAQAIIARVMTDEPRSITLQRRTVPPHIEAAVETALSKLPADRFATAALFAEALGRPGATPLPVTRRAAAARRHAGRDRVRALAPWAVAVLTAIAAAVGWWTRPAPPRTTWQYVTLGDSGPQISTLQPAVTLSPDGMTLVVKDVVLNGLLWVKRRGDLNPVAIPGTERASNPVFSPDGEWILFVADGRLKKVRPVGGTPITLSEEAAAPFGGGDWLDDGAVVYVSPSLTELYRVSAAGGTSTLVYRADSTLAGLGIGYPSALPGARGVLFTACSSGCVLMNLRVLDLRTGRQHQVINNVQKAWYLPNGQLLYVRRDGTAFVAPFDLGRLELVGEGVPVLDRVVVAGGFTQLAWSPSGTLAYLRGSGAPTEFELVRVSRSGVAVPFDTVWHGGFNSFAPSPDGRRVAVGVGLASGGLSIWIKSLDRGPFSRHTFAGQDRRPFWSPDGRQVAFVRDSLTTSHLYVRPIDGSAPDRKLITLDRQIQGAVWSPDGVWIVARTDNSLAGAGDLVGVRTRGDSTPVPIVASEFTELHPAISPDGRWIAYTSNEAGGNEVFVRPFPNAAGARWQVSNGGGVQPVWSPDQRELYFGDPRNQLVAAQIRTTPAFAVTELRPLFDLGPYTFDFFHTSYGALPGGRGFVLMRPQQTRRAAAPPQLIVSEHWFAELRNRLAR